MLFFSSLESVFTVESTLSSPYSSSDPPLTRQGAALAHLDSLSPYDLVLWTDTSIPFSFEKGGSDVFANCSLCSTKATLFFSAGPVCSTFSAEACVILQALCWSRQHQRVCYFSSLPIGLSFCPLLHLPFYSNLSARSGRNCFLSPPVLSGYNESPDTRFSSEKTWLMSWPDGERYSCPLQCLVVSLFLSLSYLLYSFLGMEA